MPPKILSQPRTWGTRFDSLISDASPPRSPQPDTTNTSVFLKDAAERISSDNSNLKDQRMSHDASIFVGSLPANYDQPELSRLLSDHLAQYKEVKYVKVIRDSRGGVCAFIQCEDASSAAGLIHTLNTNPRLFCGRYLRYEPARAFRTLLISYRTPMQYVLVNPVDDQASTVSESKHVKLDLPTVMKLWRNRGSKYLSILYNDEAFTFESSQDEYAASKGCGLYLSPVVFDAETIHKMALTFGPVEKFSLYNADRTDTSFLDPSAEDNEAKNPYPFPHDGPRAAAMEDGCWEIKWGHRDDAVSALMTLRRVPHLTVTWAHQPNPDQNPQSPQIPHLSQLGSLPYPLHIAPQSSPKQGPAVSNIRLPVNILSRPPVNPLVLPQNYTGEKKVLTIQTSKAGTVPSNLVDDVFSSNSASIMIGHERQTMQTPAVVALPSSNHPALVSGTSPSQAHKGVPSPTRKKPELTEQDFPPLGPAKGQRKAESGSCWSDRMMAKDQSEATDGLSSIGSPSLQLSTLATPRLSTIDIPAATAPEEEGQELDIPPTPDFGMSPNTPKTTGSLMFPNTPSTYAFSLPSASMKDLGTKDSLPYFRDETRKEGEIDPTTIFVGGLETSGPNAWDEGKVKAHFSKFGEVEDVKLIFPVSGRSAFAFVKFDNTEAPARAVVEEHNRLHEGRPMRVQFRDRNPPRGAVWKYGRGRGRYSQFGPSRHFTDSAGIASQETSLEKDGKESLLDPRLGADSMDAEKVTPILITYPTLLEQPTEISSEASAPPGSSGRFADVVPPGPDSHMDNEHVSPRARTPRPTSIDYPRSRQSSPQSSSHYGGHGWNQGTNTSAPVTTSPSSYASSVSATAPSIPYPVPSMAFYQPQPWMQPFAQQFPFPVPFVPGCPGYSLPSQQMPRPFTSPSGSDSSGHSAAVPVPYGRIFPQPFVQYPVYPPPQQSPQQQGNSQAPLVPTGFIQGEQGTLIPLYQPEALDQYMTTGNQQTPTPTPQSSTQNPAAWRQYPQVPTYHFIPGQPSAHHQGNVSWVSNPPVMFPAGQQSTTPTFRGRNNQHHTPNRRHRQTTYDRNLPLRPPQMYYGVGGTPVNNAGQVFNDDQAVPEPARPGIFPPHLAVNGANWGQWNGGR